MDGIDLSDAYLFDVITPLGHSVHCTASYWAFVSTVKHPSLNGWDVKLSASQFVTSIYKLSLPPRPQTQMPDAKMYNF